MKSQPTVQTERLLLRPFEITDASDVHRHVSDVRIASTTLRIPHPYEEGMAEAWIARRAETFEKEEGVTFAIVRRGDHALIGAISLHFNHPDVHAELGYWIGAPHWGNGYGTEAARAMLGYGFGEWGLHRIVARHLSRNPASGRVMQKIGMTREGELRQHVLKWGVFEDLTCYGILKSEYDAQKEG
ncbi:MAG: GNAT family N-acetyltransferase [Caldilineaceae bacterium]|nr:GNAT family N-acetyltransferase [Caldilineaceae bacterium]